MRAPLKSLDEALAEVLQQAEPALATELVSTWDADGRVLRQAAVSALHVPPQDNSAMDGYALCLADVQVGLAVDTQSATLPVSQRIAAGMAAAPLAQGTAARIFTGAPLPQGADAIAMQENCTVLPDGQVLIDPLPTSGQWIRRAGEDITRASTVLAAGVRLSPAELGLAASIGLAQLEVSRRPRVALFSTGDELITPGEVAPADMPEGAIYNANRFFLRALLLRLGCEVTDYGTVPDQREATLQALKEASASHDLVLTSGGVSVGEEDHVKPAVEQLGHLSVWQIGMKPGKPFAYGRIEHNGRSVHFMGLPGNPVSSFVTFNVLVRPFLLRLQGMTEVVTASLPATAHFNWPKPDKRREFLRVRWNQQGGLELFANQSSGVLTSAVWADGVIDNPAGQVILQGDVVRFIPFSGWLA